MGMSSISVARSAPYLTTFTIVLLFALSCSVLTPTEAYGGLHPNGNITIKWDVINWTPDGYVALVAINNFQKHDSIKAPGWRLGWTWARKEVIWSTVGGQATEQGNCKEFKGNIPVSCKKNRAIIDLKPQVPYSSQIANCCRGGALSSWFQDRVNSTSEFQLSVGLAGNTRRTAKLPKRFVFKAPGAKFTCGRANRIRPTLFVTPDKRRFTQAFMTWRVTCFAGRIKVIQI